jgi:RNA polymerase sigma factor (sigma-70 family)
MGDSGEGFSTFQQFIDNHRSKIIGVARKVLWMQNCADPAEHAKDVESEVLKKVYINWDNLTSPERALYRITTNAAIDHAQECRNQVAMEIDEGMTPCFVPPGNDPEEAIQDAILLEELLSQLDERERDVIALILDGHTSEVIGEILSMPSATVRAIKMHALTKLRYVNNEHDGTSDVVPVISD